MQTTTFFAAVLSKNAAEAFFKGCCKLYKGDIIRNNSLPRVSPDHGFVETSYKHNLKFFYECTAPVYAAPALATLSAQQIKS